MAVDLTYEVNVQYPTVEFIGGTQTRDVTAVGITTNGHGVYIEFRIPNTIYTAAQAKDYAIGYTGTVENLFTIPGVVGVSWAQAQNDSGELTDMLTYTVQSDSGNSQSQLTLPLATAGTASDNATIADRLKELNATEALTS